MAAKVKVEWVKLAPAGAAPNPDIIAEAIGEPLIIADIDAVPKLSGAAPDWPDESRARVETGYARIYVLEGAVLADWGQEADLDPSDGVLLGANPRPTYIAMRRGQKIAFIESAEAPPAGGVGGGSPGATDGSLTDLPATSGTGGSWSIPALLRGMLNALISIAASAADTLTAVFVRSKAPETVTVTIANGSSTSGVFTAEGKFVGISIPNAWVGSGNLYIEWSPDGTTGWVPVWDSPDGTAAPRMLVSATTLNQNLARHFPLPLTNWLSGGFLRLRSGTYSGINFTGENRTADRTFILSKVH